MASRLIAPGTYNTVAEYLVVVDPAPIDMIEPAYRGGTILACDRFLIKGVANADGVRVDVERDGKSAASLKRSRAGAFGLWIDPPAIGEECLVTISCFIATRTGVCPAQVQGSSGSENPSSRRFGEKTDSMG